MSFSLGDIIVLECTNNTVSKDKRVWEITAIKLGAEGQQNVVELRSLSRKENGDLRVPEELLTDMIGYKRGITVVE